MILHKILHVKQAVSEAKSTILDLRPYRSRLENIHRITRIGDGETAWSFSLPAGLLANVRIVRILTDDPDVIVFKSVEGDIEMQGMIEFVRIRGNLTQVEFTINYRFDSFVARCADFALNVVDEFVNKQLEVVRAHIDGVETPSESRPRKGARHVRPLQTSGAAV